VMHDVIVYGCIMVLLIIMVRVCARNMYEASLLILDLENRYNYLGPAAVGYKRMIERAKAKAFGYATLMLISACAAIVFGVLLLNAVIGVLMS